jgi:hypothetical protein
MRASCYSEIGNYKEAVQCICNSHQWELPHPTEEDLLFIDKFNKWGDLNTYLFKLLMGQSEVLQDYIECAEDDDEELVVALFNMIQAANRFKVDVNFVLEKYKDKLEHLDLGSNREYSAQSWGTILVKFFYELAVYHLSRNNYDAGMIALIKSIEISNYINNDSVLIKCVNLFGEYRTFASEEIRKKYKHILQLKYIV